jgi:Protein of unknown function (DUF1488)
MPLQQGEVRGYDFNRSVVEFTMLNQGKVILCAISTAAMDDLQGRRDVKPDQRVDQFMRLREVIEERASRKFFEEQAQSNRPMVLRANDFSKYTSMTLGNMRPERRANACGAVPRLRLRSPSGSRRETCRCPRSALGCGASAAGI